MLLEIHIDNLVSPAQDAQAGRQPSTTSRPMFDLFAGCGGLSLGFEHAGFTPVFVNELNDDARATYLANRSHILGNKPFGEHPQLASADVNELDEKRLSETKCYLENLDIGLNFGLDSTLDVLAGGPPCQGYSGIGHRRSYSVDKAELPSNQLYEKMAEVIESVRPRIFLFENVKGLLSSKWTSEGEKGEIWNDVYGRFTRLGQEHGYEVRWKLVHAKDYGVPQNRPRVLIIGIRSDVVSKLGAHLRLNAHAEDAVLCGFLPAYGDKAPDLIDVLGDLIDKDIARRLKKRELDGDFATLCYPKPAVGPWQEYFRPGALARVLAPVTEQEYSKHSKTVVDKFMAMQANGGEIPEKFKTKKFAQRLLPERWGNVGPSITACSLADDYVHFSQPRSLTVREWARLQTFPDTYIFKGKRTTGGLRRAGNPREGNFSREVPKYTQIGNAVPVKLAEAVAKHFDHLLTEAGF
jgi:DNA (cytosine-5)-methyltransferase 1